MTDPTLVEADTSDDAFLGGALQMLQPKDGYRAGLDAVLLAAAAPSAARMLDVGAGVGVVGLAAARRIAGANVTLVERDPRLAALARTNIARNGLSDRARLVQADVLRSLAELADMAPLAETFDCVLANPPYHTQGRGTAARTAIKANANAMPEGDLAHWARFMAALCRAGGTALAIHKTEALPELLAVFAGRFGGLLVLPVHHRAGAPAARVIVRGTKGSRAPLQILAGLILHGGDGRFLPPVEAILRHGAALDLEATG